MKKNTFKKVAALSVACAMSAGLLAGCGGGSSASSAATSSAGDSSASSEAAAPTAATVEGGTVTIYQQSDPTTVVAWDCRATQNVFWQSICQETLMVYDGNGTPQNWLIDSITPDADALTYTIKIKEGIKFSDGSDLNADAVAWNLNKYKAEGVMSASLYSKFDNAEVTGDYEVVCHFSSWDSLFTYTLARSCPIASKEAYYNNGGDEDADGNELTDGEDYLAANPIGTGPFVLTDWQHDVSMTFTRNDNYWAGKAIVDEIKFVDYAAELTAQAAMQAGELNAMATTNFGLADQMAAMGDYEIHAASLPTSAYTLCFTSNDPSDPFYDPDVRKAVSYAIDSQTIADGIGYGYATVSNQWCMEGSDFYNTDIEGQPYNVAKAKELLASAGYPDGFDTTLTVINVTGYTDVCQVIVEQLAQIGVNVTLNPVEAASYANYIAAWGGGMLMHPMGMENGAASQYAATFVQDLSFALGVNAFEHPDDLNQILSDAQSAATEDERNSLIKEAAAKIIDDYCYMKVVEIVPTIGITTGVSNMNYCSTYNLYVDYMNVALNG